MRSREERRKKELRTGGLKCSRPTGSDRTGRFHFGFFSFNRFLKFPWKKDPGLFVQGQP